MELIKYPRLKKYFIFIITDIRAIINIAIQNDIIHIYKISLIISLAFSIRIFSYYEIINFN